MVLTHSLFTLTKEEGNCTPLMSSYSPVDSLGPPMTIIFPSVKSSFRLSL